MKIPFKKIFSIDKYFGAQQLPAQAVESTLNVTWMPGEGVQIPLSGTLWLKGQLKTRFIDSLSEFLKGTARRVRSALRLFDPAECIAENSPIRTAFFIKCFERRKMLCQVN
jgi:hypothetical protein